MSGCLVGLKYKSSAGDTIGKDCFGLVRSFWASQGWKPNRMDCFFYPSEQVKVYQRQISLLTGNIDPVYSLNIVEQINYRFGDIMLFAVRAVTALDHLGIYQHGNFLHMTRQSGSVITDLTANWEKRLKGVIRCLQE